MELMTQKIKNTFYGPIPGDWISCLFKDVLDGFSSGMTPYRGVPEYYRGNIPWITSGELNYNVITDTYEKITQDAVIKTNLKLLPIGTFLMAITGLEAAGTRGSCGVTGIKATTNQSCMALFPQQGKIDSGYLYHFYVQYGNELAFKFCQGTKQQSYTGRIVKILPINLPPTLTEQKAIATVLSDVDALISSLDQLITKKKAIKQGAMQELLTGKTRLQGFAGSGRFKQTEVGRIPEEWEVKTLGDVGEVKMCKRIFNHQTSSRGEVPFYKIGTFGKEPDAFISRELYEEFRRKYSFPKKGYLLISASGTIGRTIVYRGEDSYYQDSNIIWLDNDEKLITNEYLYYILKVVKYNTEGSTIKRLYNSIIKSSKFVAPPTLTEQKAIATVLSDMDQDIERLESKKAKYQHIKQGMMQELLTGKTRLI